MIKVNAAAVVALASVVVCLTGFIQICACESDPDDCGQACHVCVDAPSLPRLSCSSGTGGLPSPCGSLFVLCGHEGEPCGERLTERGGTDARLAHDLVEDGRQGRRDRAGVVDVDGLEFAAAEAVSVRFRFPLSVYSASSALDAPMLRVRIFAMLDLPLG